MPVGVVAVQNAWLDLMLEAYSWRAGLLNAAGVELSGNGYARSAIIAPAAWAAAVGGVKRVSAPVLIGAPTGEWLDAVYVALWRTTDNALGVTVPLVEPVAVTGPGTPVEVDVAVWWAQVAL